jgi:hypothetical protein
MVVLERSNGDQSSLVGSGEEGGLAMGERPDQRLVVRGAQFSPLVGAYSAMADHLRLTNCAASSVNALIRSLVLLPRILGTEWHLDLTSKWPCYARGFAGDVDP